MDILSKDVFQAVLSNLKNKPIAKSVLQSKLQSMLGTKNEMENEDSGWYYSAYITNGNAQSTRNFCDIRIDYLPTSVIGKIYVIGAEILDYK